MRAPLSPAEIQQLLEETRQRGLARVEGDLIPGVNAIAAPLSDHKNRIAGVIGALGRAEELDVSYGASVALALLRAAARISRCMGRATQSP